MENELKTSPRDNPETLYEARKLVVRLRKAGKKIKEIQEITGYSWPMINTALKLYEEHGVKGLKPAKRGRKQGSARKLTPEQEKEIQKAICDKRPEQLKMDFALWTRKAVAAYIKETYGIEMPERTVSLYLSRWGFTPQKPIRRAYEQSPEAVKTWLDETYPDIAKRAKEEDAEIHWADETAVMNTDVRGRSYAPRGKTPVTYSVWGARTRFSMISSVNNQGKCYWMIIDGAFNSDKLIEFISSIIKDVKRKVFLIMDNLGVHHCKPVKAWLEQHADRIEAFYLPSYSPELNPDERLNADLKHAISTSKPRRTREALRKKAESHMEMVQSTPERVKGYFKDKHVQYAAHSDI